jgi:hypothetical protein
MIRFHEYMIIEEIAITEHQTLKTPDCHYVSSTCLLTSMSKRLSGCHSRGVRGAFNRSK